MRKKVSFGSSRLSIELWVVWSQWTLYELKIVSTLERALDCKLVHGVRKVWSFLGPPRDWCCPCPRRPFSGLSFHFRLTRLDLSSSQNIENASERRWLDQRRKIVNSSCLRSNRPSGGGRAIYWFCCPFSRGSRRGKKANRTEETEEAKGAEKFIENSISKRLTRRRLPSRSQQFIQLTRAWTSTELQF